VLTPEMDIVTTTPFTITSKRLKKHIVRLQESQLLSVGFWIC